MLSCHLFSFVFLFSFYQCTHKVLALRRPPARHPPSMSQVVGQATGRPPSLKSAMMCDRYGEHVADRPFEQRCFNVQLTLFYSIIFCWGGGGEL